MKRIVILGVALVASFSLVAVDAISVSASGDEFVASKTGKIKSKSSGEQLFKTSAGTIECEEVTGSSEVTELKSVTHKEVLTFIGCTGFGGNISISSATLELNANGSAKLEKRVTMKPEGAGCSVLIEPQSLEGVSYANSSGKVTVTLNLSKIHSKGTGGACGGSENTEGTYTGTILSELSGGTIEWKS